jgi:origin recognition complex subunit 1
MPHKTAPLTPRQKRAQQNEKARKLLAGANLRQDDSDDDEEYEWIYEEGNESADEGDEVASKKRKRQSAASRQERTIIGAKKGSFRCMIGDSVLLKAEDGNPPWVGIILSFLEDEDGDMAADFLCEFLREFLKGVGSDILPGFSSEKEIVNKTKKRSDFLPVSLKILSVESIC